MWQTDRRSRSLGGARRRPPVLCPRLPCTRGEAVTSRDTGRLVECALQHALSLIGLAWTDDGRLSVGTEQPCLSIALRCNDDSSARPRGAWPAPTALGGIGAKATVPSTSGDARGAQTLVVGVADARSAGHRARAKVGHRLPARVAAHGAEVVLQLVDPKSRPDLPGFRRLVRRHRVSVRALGPSVGSAGRCEAMPRVLVRR